MLLKHSLSIVVANNSLLFKVLIYMLIISLIFGVLLYAIVKPIISNVVEEIKTFAEIEADAPAFSSISDLFRLAETTYNNVVWALKNSSDMYLKAILLILALIVIIKFLVALTLVPVSQVIFSKMTQNYDEKFFNSVVATMAKSVKFSLMSVAVTVPADLAILVIGALFVSLTVPFMGLFAFTAGSGVLLALYALRLSLLGQWIPNIICRGMSVPRSFAACFRQNPFIFAKHFTSTLFAAMLTIAISSSTLFITAGLVPVVAIVFMILFYLTENLVVYCYEQKQNYYIDSLIVIDAKVHNKEENYETDIGKTPER